MTSIEYSTLFLPTPEGHTLAVYYAGNRQGLPVIYLHGGPGAACDAKHFEQFDLTKVFLIMHDQRGCGKSTPLGSLVNNTTQHLINDISLLLNYFNIAKALIFGGSWGSTLSLAFAQAHPEKIIGLVLRSICLAQQSDHRWLYEFGANQIFPRAWQEFVNFIPANERNDLVKAYYRRLTSEDTNSVEKTALIWMNWAGACLEMPPMQDLSTNNPMRDYFINLARIETHYFSHDIFLPPEQLIQQMARIAHLKTYIIHGEKDYLCPIGNAYQLHKLLPNSTLIAVPGAGHLSSALGMQEALQESVKAFY